MTALSASINYSGICPRSKTVITVVTSEHETLWEEYFLNFRNIASSLRKPALFDWLYSSYNCLYLSCVDQSMVSRLADIKTCLSMVGVVVDDSCDYSCLLKKTVEINSVTKS
jgi:hypothetical protein